VEHLIGGTGQKEISESMFKKLKIKLPSNDKEIKKISETIKDIYQDLEMENNILSQLKEQKRGLMQLLLNGIVRVEVD
jgi:type I restriction enzyme S subunit